MKNIELIDTKLLIVFDAVMRERSLTRAAQYIGMTQPAVSLAIRKLRQLLNDDLFVRVPGGVGPTPRSMELAKVVHDVLTKIQSMYEPLVFVPEQARYTFHVASSDQCAMLVLPTLHALLRTEAPGIQLRVTPKRHETYLQQLDSGDVQVVLGVMRELPNRLSHVSLFQDKFVCVMRARHPLAGKKLTRKDFLNANHLSMTHIGETAHRLDSLLASMGAKRNITSNINHSLLGPLYLESSDVILTAFQNITSHLSLYDGLYVTDIPFDVEPFDIRMAWSSLLDKHPAHVWIRKKIYDICAKFR